MIRVQRLRKCFADLVAVDDVSFEVREGEIFGLLGPNGAGKTTTINMICGVLRPDGGQVVVDDRDIWLEPQAVKQTLGVVPQEIALYEDLTARDNLDFWGSLYGLRGGELKRRVNSALSQVGLSDRAGARVKTFSGGMKRRLNLCMGLLHQPKFLLLDEPTVGIDPQARLNILETIRAVAAAGTTVLYTTHYMEEAQDLCQRIAIIDHGKILTTGSLEELIRLADEGQVVRLSGSFDQQTAQEQLAAVAGIEVISVAEDRAVVAVQTAGPGLASVLPQLLDGDLALSDVAIQTPSLQSVFIRLTGRELRD